MNTFVSAFFPLTTSKHSLETYRAQFATLVALERPVLLFLDETLDWTFPAHIRVLRCSLQDTWAASTLQDSALLPACRSPVDTLEYMRVILAKTEFLARATELVPESDWFTWVDFGLPHVFRHPTETLVRLRDLTVPSTPCIRTAGIWTQTPTSLTDAVCWRFAGGFFIAHRSKAAEFDAAVRRAAEDLLPHAVWEVNVWAHAERKGLDLGWFPSDHNDSIIPFTLTP